MLLFKLIVVILLIFIVVSLFIALYRLNKNEGDPMRVVRTLAIRVSLSIFLFVLLLTGAKLGIIQPHGVGG